MLIAIIERIKEILPDFYKYYNIIGFDFHFWNSHKSDILEIMLFGHIFEL